MLLNRSIIHKICYSFSDNYICYNTFASFGFTALQQPTRIRSGITLHSSLDYSTLIKAILDNDHQLVDRLSQSLQKHLVLYLRVRAGAPLHLAEEAVSACFTSVLQKIKEQRINDPESLLKYCMVSARRIYIRMHEKESRFEALDSEADYIADTQEDQLQVLIDQERQKQLEKCLDTLDTEKRDFILYLFQDNTMNMKEIAKKFGYSYAKARTLKSRIVQILNDCVHKK